MVYLSGAGLPRLSWKKRPSNRCSRGGTGVYLLPVVVYDNDAMYVHECEKLVFRYSISRDSISARFTVSC